MIRIEYGRALKISYEAYTITRITFTVTLTEAVTSLLATASAGLIATMLMSF